METAQKAPDNLGLLAGLHRRAVRTHVRGEEMLSRLEQARAAVLPSGGKTRRTFVHWVVHRGFGTQAMRRGNIEGKGLPSERNLSEPLAFMYSRPAICPPKEEAP